MQAKTLHVPGYVLEAIQHVIVFGTGQVTINIHEHHIESAVVNMRLSPKTYGAVERLEAIAVRVT